MINKDEYELLIHFTNNEITSYNNQLYWYQKYEPEAKEKINPTILYIKRLVILRNKLNSSYNEKENKQ